MKVIDCIPFLNENDVYEIRARELSDVVDVFLVVECRETFGGDRRELKFDCERFAWLGDRLKYVVLDSLEPKCSDRVTGRQREAFMRDAMLPYILESGADVAIIADCDEIPSADAVRRALRNVGHSIQRFAQRSFYYAVNWLVDVGHDFASRARMGTVRELEAIGSVYKFRMAPAIPVEDGGWHFGYFSDIKEKVAALSPFLAEYKLFGDEQLNKDIEDGRDLHHRNCELPKQFTFCPSNDPTLPAYFLANMHRFAHFTLEGRP